MQQLLIDPKWRSPILASAFCLLTILGAKVSVPIWEVPFTLQTVAVYICGLFLVWQWAAISQVTYILLGLFLPVFAGDGSGFDYLFTRVSSGYLLSFPFVAVTVSVLSRRWPTGWGKWLALQFASLLLFICGVTWLFAKLQPESWFAAAQIGWFKYIPVDQLKIGTSLAVFYLLTRLIRQIKPEESTIE